MNNNDEKCIWKNEDPGWYHTSCGAAINDDISNYCHSISDYDKYTLNYCPNCGRKIVYNVFRTLD